MRDRNAPLGAADVPGLAWAKMDGLIPVVVQDPASGAVLMLGYMNAEALGATLESGFVTFFSRSKERLWMKGESSGNRLTLVEVREDCDGDALLVQARPEGPTCHLGASNCFMSEVQGPGWLTELSRIVASRASSDDDKSYTRHLLNEGVERIAQKVGEEGVEIALAGVTRDAAGCAEETADLLYHLSVLMEAKGYSWEDVIAVLRQRHAG
ncbi:MAG: bifunctional phosphoribosyl-AMP cyclohydrolase/phosphoribosyl-ATP diphosphatase HisIE [Sphingomicrobium sp.]